MSEKIDRRRRGFLGLTAATLAAAQFGEIGSSKGEGRSNKTTAVRATAVAFAPLKRIEAGLLNVGYAEAGPLDGPAVILLHGWPYDIYSFVDVTPVLAETGYVSSCLTCGATAPHASCLTRHSGTDSPRRSPPISSR